MVRGMCGGARRQASTLAPQESSCSFSDSGVLMCSLSYFVHVLSLFMFSLMLLLSPRSRYAHLHMRTSTGPHSHGEDMIPQMLAIHISGGKILTESFTLHLAISASPCSSTHSWVECKWEKILPSTEQLTPLSFITVRVFSLNAILSMTALCCQRFEVMFSC